MSVGVTVVLSNSAWLMSLVAAAVQAAEAFPQQRADSDLPTFALEAAYTAEVWRNTQGGLRTGGTYLDKLDLIFDVDAERAWAVSGLRAHAHLMYGNGGRFSDRYVGDAMVVSNIDAPAAVRLYEVWAEWLSDAPRPLSLRLGLYDLNSEFDMSDARLLFIHSSHGVGHELGQTGENGPSIFPNTSLAVRAAWSPLKSWRFLAAVLDAVPGDPDDSSRTRIHLSRDEGALGIAEAQWFGGRVIKFSLGHWRYTAPFADVLSTEAEPLPERRDNSGSYAAFEVALGQVGAEAGRRSSAFVRYGVAEGRINEFDRFLGMGVRYKGVIAGRPDDELGFALAHARVGGAARRIATAAGSPREAREAAIELTYRAAINDRLTIQPDIQYIFNPGADQAKSDSLVLGVRVELSAAASR